MPVAAFEGEVVVVDQPDQVADAIAYLRTQKIVGVDTEARPSVQRGIPYGAGTDSEPRAMLSIPIDAYRDAARVGRFLR